MSPRKTILRELAKSESGAYKRPSEIRGFEAKAPKYREAVNELLKEQLIRGAQDEEGKLVVGLNHANIGKVKRAMRPWFAAPLVWGALLGVVALAALGLLS